ncbi:MAG: tagaturonate reductase [Clostridia bacterium]|nr:tagaturonate reductase [Clostridia bacterium]MBR6290704.1 tagaturonate reductase [Clostridia bacterium]
MRDIKEIGKRVERPVRVVQFGEGNFLRAFADRMIDEANEKGVFDGNIVLVKPIEYGNLDLFREQDCFYTAVLRGRENGETVSAPRLVTSVARAVGSVEDYAEFMALARGEDLKIVVSNTTEAGIAFSPDDRLDMEPPATYPGKLTKFLYERYTFFGGDEDKGLMILPVELIENNGGALYDCVTKFAALWGLPDEFVRWLDTACLFCSTLVDRIVTGYPKGDGEAEKIWEELGYRDRLVTVGEPFALWVIETKDPDRARSVFDPASAGLPVIYTDNMKPYRERKVRILNGAHTSFCPTAFLAGRSIVRDCMRDPVVRPFIDRCVYREIMPTVKLPAEEVKRFADSVMERFDNPFIDHALISICLNSVSKWKARVLPSLLDYLEATGKLPEALTMSFAGLCAFYASGSPRGGGLYGVRNGEEYRILDDGAVLSFFTEHHGAPDLLDLFAARSDFWGRDLTAVPGFLDTAKKWYGVIRTEGAEAALKKASVEND